MNISKRPFGVIITDYSEYDPRRCCNGGGYWYSTEYHLLPSGKYEVSYDTSAEFPYNHAVGGFGEDESEYEYETVSLTEVIHAVLAARKEGLEVVVKYE